MGASDLGGEFTVDMGKERPVLGGKLHSKLLDIKDLGGFVGAAPGTAAPKTSGKVLPANAINLEKLRRVDAKVTLTAAEFRNKELPLDNLKAKLDLVDGVFRLDPDRLRRCGRHGELSCERRRARQERWRSTSTARSGSCTSASSCRRPKLLEKSLGAIDGRTRFKGHGNSVAAVLGTANGRVDLMSGGGQVSNLMLEFAGADIAEIVKFWVGGDRQVELRCGVVAFNVEGRHHDERRFRHRHRRHLLRRDGHGQACATRRST